MAVTPKEILDMHMSNIMRDMVLENVGDDELPESSMGELGTNVLATDGITYYFAFVHNNRWFSNDERIYNILHWKPLPTPPEKTP